jgi:hypothetical protein
MDRKPRIAIDPKTFKALKVWSALEGIALETLVGKLTFANIPDRVRDALGDITPKPSSPPGTIETSCETVEDAVVCEVVTKRPRKTKKATTKFGDDTEATSKAGEMWAGGERNVTKIARQFPDYSVRQVSYWIGNEIKNGRLSKEAPPSTS